MKKGKITELDLKTQIITVDVGKKTRLILILMRCEEIYYF